MFLNFMSEEFCVLCTPSVEVLATSQYACLLRFVGMPAVGISILVLFSQESYCDQNVGVENVTRFLLDTSSFSFFRELS